MQHWTLMLKKNPIRTFSLNEGETITIGRTSEADIVLDNPSVSRIHAVVELDNGGNYITDIGSTNGTWVNGVRIGSRALLAANDQVMIGKFELVQGPEGGVDQEKQSRAIDMGGDPRTIYVAPDK